MSFGSILDTIIFGPLRLLFEVIFSLAFKLTENIGASIVLLSLAINVLVLPLYMCADAMQEKAKLTQKILQPGITHIKKTFKGDERMMMLQAYYKQNHYSPLSALSGSVSLLLEIPFFVAAYDFLSTVSIFQGASLGPIANLGVADAMIKIGSFSINVLPILMTAINIVASVQFLKGATRSSKIQMYGLAIFFLIFLYTSPAGLVFYWTLNNIFSLIKTIFYKIKNPKKVIKITLSITGIIFFLMAMIDQTALLKIKIFAFVMLVLLQLPVIITMLKKKIKFKQRKPTKTNRKMFMLGCACSTVLIGLLIPSAYIAASPQEFVNIFYFVHPIWYVVSSACLAVGVFFLWFQVFYWLASERGKAIFDKVVCAIAIVGLVNYLFFGTNLGVISSLLQFEGGMHFKLHEYIVNSIIVVLLCVGLYYLTVKCKKITIGLLVISTVAIGGMFGVNSGKIVSSINKLDIDSMNVDETPTFELSKNGQNVVVIMLDRAQGAYVPYILKEKPELKETFSGFTYYSNTMSYGGNTNFSTPSMLGGYDYTPVELNKRTDKKLAEKQNEANLLMPRVFTEQANEEFKATIFDPVYTNYLWISDLSIYDLYPKIKARNIIGAFTDEHQRKAAVTINFRNFFCLSLMKTSPIALQKLVYNKANYNRVSKTNELNNYTFQTIHSVSKASNISNIFMDNYKVLDNLNVMTEIAEGDTNTYMFMRNDITHEPMLVDETTYEPAWVVDNTEYDKVNQDRFEVDGLKLTVQDAEQMRHYQANVVAFLKIGKWLDYLKEQGVYDNTRIIIVSDHGARMSHMERFLMFGEDIMAFFPLLIVKDFNATEFTTSKEFMTVADVPTIATKDLIENPTNPYTDNPINSERKEGEQFVILSREWSTDKNNGNAFFPSTWLSIEKDIWNKDNIKYYSEVTTIPSASR